MTTTVTSGLGKRLVDQGILSANALSDALHASLHEKLSLVSYLVQNELATAAHIAVEAAEEFGIPVFDLDAFDAELLPRELVEPKLILHHRAIPLMKRGTRLFVALSDPTNLTALDEMRFATGLTTDPILVEEDKLSRLLEQASDD
ncbi:MAG: type IV-A pilus assembly ATPase PilB, partial [Natronospirillum sp.]